jgi:hypothetical protein
MVLWYMQPVEGTGATLYFYYGLERLRTLPTFNSLCCLRSVLATVNSH